MGQLASQFLKPVSVLVFSQLHTHSVFLHARSNNLNPPFCCGNNLEESVLCAEMPIATSRHLLLIMHIILSIITGVYEVLI